MKFVKYLVCLMLLLVCTGCKEASADSAANDFMKALKKGDENIFDVIYVEGNDSGSTFMNNLFSELSNSSSVSQYSDVIKEKLLDFDYDIKSVREEGNNAIAEVSLTTENWAQILQDVTTEFLPKVLVMILDGKDSKDIEKELTKYIKEEKSNTEDVTTNFELPLVKVDDKWKVNVSSVTGILQSALMGSQY